ncbi:MAG: hypothetical protein NZM06_05065 [Chloroherpetonaceae bacterium]|nr:hypothetical protein [Chloroherpetonaceae bacterium]MDW8437958.1 DUF4175 family protein [Chloroherpetonaceae bacterium]
MTHYDELLSRLRAVHRKATFKTALVGACKVASLALGAMWLAAVAEWAFRLSSPWRMALFALVALVLVGAAIWFLIFPLVQRRFNPDDVARELGKAFPALRDRLLNAMQVFRESPDNPFAVVELRKVSELCAPLNFGEAVRFEDSRKLLIGAPTWLLLTAFAFWFSPLGSAWGRVMAFGEDFSPPPPFRIVSLTKDVQITKGKDAELRFALVPTDSLNPLDVRRLSVKFLDENGFEVQEAKTFRDSSGAFSYKLRSPETSLQYFAEFAELSKPIRSETHRLVIIDRPRVDRFQLVIEPPRYSRLATQVLEANFGDGSALKGSRVSIALKASKPLRSATLVANDSLSLPMTVQNDSAFFSFALKDDFVYRFALVDSAGVASEKGADYRLRSMPDEPPQIRFVQPAQKQVDLPDNLRLPLAMLIRDDFGVSSLGLHYRVSKSNFKPIESAFRRIEIAMNDAVQTGEGGLERGVFYEWNLLSENVSAGDEIEFYAEARDNDAVSGFKPARTDFYKLRLPTLDELFDDVQKQEQDIVAELDRKIDETKSVQEELERIQNELRQKTRSDWQDRKAMELASQKQKELQDQLEAIEQAMTEMLQKMQDRSLVSEETLRKYEEIRQLLEELKSPELQEAQRQFDEALKQLNEQQLREALKNFEFNEERFKQNLERAKDLLERMKLERQLDEALKRLDDMAQKQESLQQETKQTNPENKAKLSELKKEQESLAKEERKLDERLQTLIEQMEKNPKAEQLPLQELAKLKERRNDDNLQKDLQEASKALSESKPQDAQAKQQEALRKMQAQRQQLADLRQEMKRQRKQDVLQALQNATQAALELSQRQEALMEDLRQKQGSANGDALREKMTEQNDVKELLKLLQDDVSQIGRKSSELRQSMIAQLRRAEAEMDAAIETLDQRNAFSAAQRMNNAMALLNEFGNQAASAMAQLMGQQGAPQPGEGGDGEEMEGLANRQGELNQQTEALFGERQGMSPEARAQRLAQLAAQQRLIQRQLQQLAQKQAEQKAKGEKSDLLGNLEKLADEMQKAAEQLERQDLSPELKNRQRQILSRMLESTKAIQKREQDERREAKSAKNIFKASPPELSQEQTRNPIQDGLNRMKAQGFSDDYERLIRRYYEALEKQSAPAP